MESVPKKIVQLSLRSRAPLPLEAEFWGWVSIGLMGTGFYLPVVNSGLVLLSDIPDLWYKFHALSNFSEVPG